MRFLFCFQIIFVPFKQNGKENMKRSAADESSNDPDNFCDNNSRNTEVNSSANDDDWKRHLPAVRMLLRFFCRFCFKHNLF